MRVTTGRYTAYATHVLKRMHEIWGTLYVSEGNTTQFDR